MGSRILILFIASLTTLLFARSRQPKEQRDMTTYSQSRTEQHAHTHAKAKITVENSEARPYDQTAGPTLIEINITERFTGDIDGEPTVRALQVQGADKSASMVSVQRFRGKLGGRQGTFVPAGLIFTPTGRNCKPSPPGGGGIFNRRNAESSIDLDKDRYHRRFGRGTLALGLLASLKTSTASARSAIIGGVALSPVTDLSLTGASWKTRASADPYFTHPQAF